MKELINIKNNDNKCFLWCHIEHLNPLSRLMILIMKELNFLFLKKITEELKDKTIFALMYFAMKIIGLILLMYQIKNLKIVWICC